MMGKYEPLGQFLKKQLADQIVMSFAEIEKIIGTKLPKSKSSRAFWSNNSDNNVMTKEWLLAGFETKSVDTRAGELIFIKTKNGGQSNWDQVYGCMKGIIKFAPDLDPSSLGYSPEEWDEIEAEWDRNWDELMRR